MSLVRQLVEGIDMLYSGIDLHKHVMLIHTVAEDGTAVREAELATARPAVTACFATVPGPHRMVECLGSWYWVRDLPALVQLQVRLEEGRAPHSAHCSMRRARNTVR